MGFISLTTLTAFSLRGLPASDGSKKNSPAGRVYQAAGEKGKNGYFTVTVMVAASWLP